MKYFIVTDIHGSAYWAKKAADKFIQTHSDVMVVLGDVYNHGPRNPFPKDYAPMEVAEILNGIKNLTVIQGNCDSEVDQMISRFQFVRENAVYSGGRKFFFTHGHIHNKQNLPFLCESDVMFYGHTHVNEISVAEGIVCVNVSSCALPKDGVSVYCIADENCVSVYGFDDALILQFDLTHCR